MQAYIGLTKVCIEKYNETVTQLRELGILSIKEAEESGVLIESELFRIKLVNRVNNNPEIDLWKQSVEIL